ncbi:unnamed protein product [Schistosoma margrebowiei]|uniref:Uncharacterized protein n=1 Tax=Schistosoma margrebowiei TaxID=48269 RepID=A0AA84ZZE2_9TREM|nr:unnamed protein product [Schistosoma margrebowiei]
MLKGKRDGETVEIGLNQLGKQTYQRQMIKSSSSFRQLDMIFNLLGSPHAMELIDLVGFPSSSIDFIRNCPVRPFNHAAVSRILVPANTQYFQSPTENPPDLDLVNLFTGLLSFSSVSGAFNVYYLWDTGIFSIKDTDKDVALFVNRLLSSFF